MKCALGISICRTHPTVVKTVPLSASVFVLVLLLLLTSIPYPAWGCDSETGSKIILLPSPLSQTAAAALDGKVYIFGGVNASGMQKFIMVFDPATNAFTTLDVKLPNALNNPDAFTDGKRIFVIGGTQERNAGLNANLTIFTPPNNVDNHPNFFPYGIEGIGVVSDGKYFYLVGNCLGSKTGNKNILRFDPETLEIKVFENVLKMDMAGMSCVWYNGAAYIFGGMTRGSTPGSYLILDTVLKYTPDKDLQTLDVHMPVPLMKNDAILKGDMVYILGGLSSTRLYGNITSFDLKKQTFDQIYLTLCSPKACRAVVTIGDKVYMVGGDTSKGPAEGVEEIVLPVLSR
jgi:N-acetylneuraminic acid mutarotase